MPERPKKGSTKLYYSISEVAELLNVKPHVLRYWETQFKMLRPRKNRAGNRSYREKEVQLALRIKRLLYEEGFTIAGARRKLLDERRSGQSQTELNFVGLSQEEFVGVLRRDLEELLAVVRGEPLPKREDGPTDGAAAAGLLAEVGAMADEPAGGDQDKADSKVAAVAAAPRGAGRKTKASPAPKKPRRATRRGSKKVSS